MSDVWYHATPKRNCADIERNGLMPGFMLPGAEALLREWHPEWNDQWLAKAIAEDRVHLSRDPGTEWVAMIQDIEPDDIAVYEVDLAGLPVEPGWDDDDEECAVAVVIEPSRLRRIT